MSAKGRTANFVVPVALGWSVFAAILLTDGTEDLNWVRFLVAALAFWSVTWGSGYVMVNVIRRRRARDSAARRC